MIKIDLSRSIAGRMDITIKEADEFITVLTDLVGECLQKGEPVLLAGFGQFSVRFVPEHTGRNPKTGENLQVPASYYPMFRAGKKLKEQVACINAQSEKEVKTRNSSTNKKTRSAKKANSRTSNES